MGRRPQPTALKLLQGTKPSRINDDEPKPAQAEPEKPDFPSAEAEEIWNFTVAHLRRMGTLAVCDRDMLVAYCQAVHMHRAATREMHKRGMYHLVGDRQAIAPWVRVVQETAATIAKLASHFGLSPAARTSVKVGAAKGDEKDDRAARFA